MIVEHATEGELWSHIEKGDYLHEEQDHRIFTHHFLFSSLSNENNISHRDIKLCDFCMAIKANSGQKFKGGGGV